MKADFHFVVTRLQRALLAPWTKRMFTCLRQPAIMLAQVVVKTGTPPRLVGNVFKGGRARRIQRAIGRRGAFVIMPWMSSLRHRPK